VRISSAAPSREGSSALISKSKPPSANCLASPSQTTVQCRPDESVIATQTAQETTNYTDAHGSGWVALDEATMRSWRAQGMTQVLRLVYLQHFGGAGGAWNLTPDLFNKVDTDLGTARRAGVKVILRLAYNLPPARVWPPPAPYGDAPVERTLHHIHQLVPSCGTTPT